MYDSNDLYDFATALAAVPAKRTSTTKEAASMDEANYWQSFADGSLYRDVSYGHGTPGKSKPAGKLVFRAPTSEQMHRHVARFGAEGTGTIIAAYGLDMKTKPKAPRAKRQRRTSDELREEARQLHARGMLVPAIADVLNVGDRRVKELLVA